MAPGVLRSKSAPTTKPLSAHFLPKTVSFSTLDTPSRLAPDLQKSETKDQPVFESHMELYRPPIDSPLTQRVEAFNLSGGFFPSEANEYDWVSVNDDTTESPSRTFRTLPSGLHTPAASESPVSSFSSLPPTPGVGLVHRPLPDELDHMASEAIRSEDKMGVLKITARSLSTFILGSGGDADQPELPPDAEPLSDEALYSSIRARRQEATTPYLPSHIPYQRDDYDPTMKLDATDLRYITNDEFRVLTS
ncbi:hypothetical protein FRC06_003957, partial [Ceratobasidium sp. 370]